RRERVGNRRLPAAGSGGWEQEDLPALGLEDPLQVAEQRQSEIRQIRCALVFHGDVHGATHPLRDIGRTRNKETSTARHDVPPSVSLSRSSSACSLRAV